MAGFAVTTEACRSDRDRRIGNNRGCRVLAASSAAGIGFPQMPLEKDPSRVVRLQNVVIPPGAGNQFHRHPGDQWWAV
jgi:quercetin dioxygenase-like cupin family protein